MKFSTSILISLIINECVAIVNNSNTVNINTVGLWEVNSDSTLDRNVTWTGKEKYNFIDFHQNNSTKASECEKLNELINKENGFYYWLGPQPITPKSNYNCPLRTICQVEVVWNPETIDWEIIYNHRPKVFRYPDYGHSDIEDRRRFFEMSHTWAGPGEINIMINRLAWANILVGSQVFKQKYRHKESIGNMNMSPIDIVLENQIPDAIISVINKPQ